MSADGLQSRSFNSPWLGHELTARVKLTLAAGRVAWEDLASVSYTHLTLPTKRIV